jgi:hypothetical protein
MDAEALTGFVKTSPSNGATGLSLSLKLDWEKAPSNPYDKDTYYKYCYYTGSGKCDFQGVIYTTEYTISGLTKNTKYYWQVQVIYCKDNSCTQKEKHDANNGAVWSFTTSSTAVDPPGSFAKTSPANSAINVMSRVLSWGSSSGATSYQYCFSPNYGDTNCTYLGGWKDVGNVTTYTLPNDSKFVWGNRYYWEIRASNAGGTKLADDGTWWSFTVSDLIGTATLLSPTGVINDSTPTYRWNEVPNATWYYLWVEGPSGNVLKKWYEETAICGGGTCQVLPRSVKPGNHLVDTDMGSVGCGPWAIVGFNLRLSSLCFPVSPTGNIGVPHPTYGMIQKGRPLLPVISGSSEMCSSCGTHHPKITIMAQPARSPGKTLTGGHVHGGCKPNSAGTGAWAPHNLSSPWKGNLNLTQRKHRDGYTHLHME